ncbi:hypothetical protein CYMTET_36207 [Cymbomonas tetramitiformis]|nr:hypothetical protein CYMTET_36207 [Cymbomonas tetramitiformis]
MAGQGLAGLGVSLTSILTLMAQPQADSDAAEHDYKVEPNAFSYFLVAFMDLLLCLVGYFCLNRVRFFRYHANANAEEIANYVKEASAAPDAEEASTRAGLESPLLEPAGSPRWSLLRMPTLPRTPRGGVLSLAQQMSNAQQYRLAVLLIFFGTLSMFPGITSLIASTTKSSNRFFNDLFVPFSFVVFNATDSIGRIGSGWAGSKAPTGRTMLTAACVRLACMPIFLFCNVVPSSSGDSWSIPVLFESDVFPIMFNAIMGLSNGYLGSLCMMHAPSFVHPSQRQDEGTKMALSLISGCTLGCIATLVVSVILKD